MFKDLSFYLWLSSVLLCWDWGGWLLIAFILIQLGTLWLWSVFHCLSWLLKTLSSSKISCKYLIYSHFYWDSTYMCDRSFYIAHNLKSICSFTYLFVFVCWVGGWVHGNAHVRGQRITFRNLFALTMCLLGIQLKLLELVASMLTHTSLALCYSFWLLDILFVIVMSNDLLIVASGSIRF